LDFQGIEIVCPVCKADLEENKGSNLLSCVSCERQFPVLLGIPDLRVFSDPYIDMEGDRKKGSELAERCAGLDFERSVDVYYSLASKVPASQAQQFKRGLMGAVARAEVSLRKWEAETKQDQQPESLLEIGCGTAPLLVVTADFYKHVVGVDIAFRWLVIAKKRLADSGTKIPLICACAEALPFPDGFFDRVVADSVLEHLQDQPKGLSECHRVMRPAGYLCISTPNRYSLGPDPQVGIWAGGYLPERWLAAYVRWQGGNPPKRRLLSAASLSILIREAGFSPPRISLPDVPPGQRNHLGRGMNLLIDFYHTAKRLPFSRQLLYWAGPLLHAVSEKPGVTTVLAAGRE